jgi:hypothetical protein
MYLVSYTHLLSSIIQDLQRYVTNTNYVDALHVFRCFFLLLPFLRSEYVAIHTLIHVLPSETQRH